MRRGIPFSVDKDMRIIRILALLGVATFCAVSGSSAAEIEQGFTSLFNGRNLDGWRLVGKRGEGYGVKDGLIYCAKGGGGNLFTEREFTNFILRLEFKLEAGANNGVAIRSP